ncbi:RHS repeat-associated core domain-containing protein [Cohnella boryungensis]|uniref:RHS repeat-associated core domain-containing protein n=1 Tax=Cohnella boryungensis TaxID=768479 RepID=UPI0036726193
MNNLIGPKQQYNTMLSPVYLKNNKSEEYISPQNGELTLTQSDYVLPGRNGLDLEIKRIYKNDTSNVQEMKVKYLNGAWVDYVSSDIKTSSFNEDRYNLGIGMRFSFPMIEVKQNSDGTSTDFLHTQSGDVYRLKADTLAGASVLLPEGQTIKDVVVRTSTAFSNGQNDGTSKFVMTEKEGKKTYFAADGRILGIVDRYGNTIKFEYTTLSYTLDGQTVNKRLISQITDTIGRVTTIEYKEDPSLTVGLIENNPYSASDSYKASQNPNNTDSGDLQGKFQVIVHLPENKQIVYDKSAVLVSSSKHVMRTRLQRVIDVDNSVKYHYWYEQPELGFTYMNGKNYAVYNRYENLVQIDYVKTNRIKRYVYNTYTKRLNSGSMQYRKIFEAEERVKKSYDASKSSFLDRFVTEINNKTGYSYTNEPDGFGTSGYNEYNIAYLRDTYRYSTQTKDLNGATTTYTYDGLHQLITTENKGNDHNETITTERDELKLVKKKATVSLQVVNGVAQGVSVKKIENYRYDEYGNMTNYTGPEAVRDAAGYPLDSKHTVVYTYAYDKFHVLTSKTWNKDKSTTSQILYDVDSKGNVIKETRVNAGDAANWTTIDYQYDNYGNMTQKKQNAGGQSFVTNYEYGMDANGKDTKGAYLSKKYAVVEGTSFANTYAYDFNAGNLTEEIDPNGNQTVYEYDALSRVVQTSLPNGSLKKYVYQENPYINMKIQQTDPNGNQFIYTYDILGNLLQASLQANGQIRPLTTYEYDAKGNKTKETDANGNSILYAYDSAYSLVRKTYKEKDTVDKGSIVVKYTILNDSANPFLVTITDQDGYVKKYYYDILNRLVRLEKTPDNNHFFATAYSYNYVGDLLSETDARGGVTRHEYDYQSRRIKKVDALGNETGYVYNALDQISQQTEPGGKVTRVLYDAAGRKSEQRVHENGSADYIYTKYIYDAAGNAINIKQGQTLRGQDNVASDISYMYDKMNRISDEYHKIDASRKSHIRYSYDSNGNKTQEIRYADAGEKEFLVYTYDYDYADRVKQESGALKAAGGSGGEDVQGSYNKKNNYDDVGNLIEQHVDNGNGYDVTAYTYDYLNHVIEKKEPFTDNSHFKYSTYKYDKRGNQVSATMTIQGQPVTVSIAYDGLGRQTSMVDPLGGLTQFVYDENGNLIKKVDSRYMSQSTDQAPGIEYVYDALNRVVKTSVYDGNARTVTDYREYDGRGNLTLEADGEGYNESDPARSLGKKYVYNVLDKTTSYISAQTEEKNRKNGSRTVTSAYTYDAVGNVLSQTDALGNRTTNIYYLNGMLKETVYPDGKKDLYDYDLTGKIRAVKTDRAGNTTTAYSNVFGQPYRIKYPDGTSKSLKYSSKGELTESIDQAGNRTLYTYDPSGNATAKREFIRTDGAHAISKLTQSVYDEANRLIEQETYEARKPLGGSGETAISSGDKVQQVYDKAGRLVRVSGPFGREKNYEYDRAGNQITEKQKVSDSYSDVKRYAYDVQSRLISESTLVQTSGLEMQYLAGARFDNEFADRVLSTTTYMYYKNSLIKSKTDPHDNKTTFIYDADGKLTKQTDPLLAATEYSYDDNGNLVGQLDAKGVTTRYEYDGLNRLIRQIAPAADGSDATTRYLYDAMGNLIKQISPNQYDPAKDTADQAMTMTGISYTYNAMNRLISTVSPDGDGLSYIRYDANGRVQKTVDGLRYTGNMDASQGSVYEYDGLGQLVKETDALGNITLYAYDVKGHLISQIDANGNTTVYNYNPDGTLKSVTYADGGASSFGYDKLGRKTVDTDQRGHTTTYSYNGLGKQRTVTDPYGNTLEFKTDLAGNPISQKDKRGSVKLFKYDANNRLVEKRTPLEFDASGNVMYAVETTVYDKVGNVIKQAMTSSRDKSFVRETRYTYTDNNLALTVSDNGGAYTKYTYDKNGNVVKKETLRDNDLYDVEEFSYDNQDRTIADIRLVDEQSIAEAASLIGISGLRDPAYPGRIRLIKEYEYDILGNKIKQIDPRAYAFAADDTDNRGMYTVTYTYDALGRVDKIIRKQDGKDVYTQYTYDKVGNKTAIRNERGFVTTYAYDSMNRSITVTDSLNQSVTTQYDSAGNRIAVTNAKGDTMSFAYDQLNRLVSTTDAYGTIIEENAYDANGNVIKKIDAKGYLSSSNNSARYGWLYTYDLANRLIQTVDPELAAKNNPALFKAAYRYNASGEKTEETDALGNKTVFVYDAAGYLVQVTDPLGIATRYGYDNVGNKLYMTDGRGKTTQYAYGAFGLLTQVTNADQKTIQYSYDLGSNLAVMIDRNGNHTRYTYDNRDLLLTKNVDETGDRISYTYDEKGNRASMTDASGTSSYSYDSNDKLLEVVKNESVQLTYTYDVVGNVSTVTDQSGFVTTYTYDKSNRMSTVVFDGKTVAYAYDPNGNRTSISYAGGVTESYTYDKNNQLLTLINQAPGGSVISQYSYTYDNVGKQLSKADGLGTTNYLYDAAGRILEVKAPGKTTMYTYDGAGNRQALNETYVSDQLSGYVDRNTKQALPYRLMKSQYVYSNANELLKLVETMYDERNKEVLKKTTDYLYDNNGNGLRTKVNFVLPYNNGMRQATDASLFGDDVTGDISALIENVSNTFDGFNRLVKTEKIKGGNRSTVTFVYDGNDLRTQKVVRSSEEDYAEKTTNYIYDRQYVILETDASGDRAVRYVNGVNYIARIDASSKLSYYLFNGHGDVVQTVNETGEVENQYDYDIFGNPTLTIEKYAASIRYAGEFFDAEVGLYYLRARYYDPYIGRFISEDTYEGRINDPLSLNRYTYAHNDPIMYVDPTGYAAMAIRDLAALTGSTVVWNQKSGIATVTLSPGVSVEFNTKSSTDQAKKGYTVKNGQIIIDNKQFDSLMSQNNTKSQSSVTGGKVTVQSKVETAVGDNKLIGYASVTKTYYAPESQQKSSLAANFNMPQIPLVVKEKERVAVLDLTTHKLDSIDLVSGKGLTKKNETLIKNIVAGSEGTVSRPQAALITLLLGQDNSTFSKYLQEKYSGSYLGKDMQSSDRHFVSNKASNEIMKNGKISIKAFERGLKKYYHQAFQEATEQDYQNYVKTLNQAQSGDMVDVLNAYFSKEALLYGGYSQDMALAEVGWAMMFRSAGFSISKGVVKFAPKAQVFLNTPAAKNGTLNIGAGSKPIQGAYNIDAKPGASGVHLGDATNLSNVATGSQSRVIMENPYRYDVLNPEVSRVLQRGGTLEITGGLSNKTFNTVYKMSDEELKAAGYTLVSKGQAANAGTSLTTTGEPIRSMIMEIILKKN